MGRATVYLARAHDFEATNAAYRHRAPADPPARTSVVKALVVLGSLVEIEVVATASPPQQPAETARP